MIEINEKSIPIKNNIYLYKSFFLLKSNFPFTKTFFYVLFFLKYLGIIVDSRIIEMVTGQDTVSLNKYFKNLFIFGNDFSAMHKHYFAISLAGAIIVLMYGLYYIFCLLYMRYKYINITSIMDEKAHGTNENFENILFKILSYFALFFIFFNQYILEYYFFGVFAFIYNQLGITSKIGVVSKYATNLEPELLDYIDNENHIPILIINLIVIIAMLCLLTSYLMFSSVRGLFMFEGVYCGNIKYIILKVIMFNFQPFFVLTRFYSDDHKIKIGIIFNVFIIFFCLIMFWNCYYQFGYYPTEVTNMCLYLEFFVFVSSIDEIIIYYVGYKESSIFFFIKLFVELINSLILTKLFLYLKDKSSAHNFAKNLFSKNNADISKSSLYYYMRTYLDYQKNKNTNYIKLFRIILFHVKQCKKMECPGRLLISKDYLKSLFVPFSFDEKSDWKNNIFVTNETTQDKKTDFIDSDNSTLYESENKTLKEKENKEKIEKKIKNENRHFILEKKKLTEKQFQIIFEQEIMKNIEYLFKTKKFYDLEHLIFIHLQYLYKMKKNFALCLYYIGKYSKCGIKWNFITQYYLYEYKTMIIRFYFNKLNINNADKTVNKYRKDNLMMTEIIDYFVLLALLNQLIISSCDKLKTLFNFRKNLHNPLILKTYKHSNTNVFLKKGEELRYNIDKILSLIRLGLNQNNKDNISAELIYIINNFLLITLNKIPEDLRKVINSNLDINTISSKLESGYKFFNLVHPLILGLTKNNTFNITYFSCVISNKLGFYQHELKGKDFHEKLFPGVKFIKQHELMMKQFLFFSYNTFAKANTFIKTKEGYLMGVSMVGKKYPTFYDDFYLIIGLDFNERLFYSKINKSFNRYSFLLDENSEFTAETKNFMEDFEFNVNMFKDIKTNFFEFFCVDKNKIMEKIKKKNKELFKHGVNNIYNFKKEEDAFTLFKNISYEKAYELRDISRLENINNEFIVIYDKIEKDKIIKVIPELSKLIEEYGLDFEWYQHLQNLSDRLTIKEVKTFLDDNLENSLNILTMGQSINNSQKFKKTLSPNFIINNTLNTPNVSLNLKNKESKDNIFSTDSLGRPSYASVSSASKKNFYNKMAYISFDRNFDVVYNLKKMGTIYFYIVDLYERTIYSDDNSNGLKKKYSFNNKNGNEIKVSNLPNIKEENRFIKAKTLFNKNNNKLNIKKNFDFSNKNILIDEESNENQEMQKGIEKMKTWDNKNVLEEEQIKGGENRSVMFSEIHRSAIKSPDKKKINLINSKESEEGNKFVKKSQKDLKILKYNFNDNNSFNYNNRNSRDEDEENISLISKDQIEELRKKNYEINKTYIITLIILFIVTLVIISVKLYYVSTNFVYILNLTSALIYLEEIKADIFTGSVIVMSQCLRIQANDIPTGLNDISLQLAIKGMDLMTHISSFEKQLNLINDNSLLSRIRLLLYKNITIENLNQDWSKKVETSYLIKEINYFGYLLNTAAQSAYNVTCNFEENFFLLAVVNDTSQIYEITKMETSFNQKFIYYVLENIIYEIQPVIVEILEELTVALLKTLDLYMNKVVIIYICLLLLIIAIEIIFLIKNKSEIHFMKQIFVFLYNYENNQLKKEFEINFLQNVAKEFNINNIMLLEKIKKDNNFFYSLISNYITTNLNDNSNNHDEIIKNENKNGKNKTKEKPDESLINNYQKIRNDFEQNSMNGSLLNNSMNNNSSMIQFLNKNNNKEVMNINDLKNARKSTNKMKKGKKNKSINNNEINKMKLGEEKIFKENEDVLELLKTNRKIVPLKTIISLYISIIVSLLFLAIIFISFFDLYRKSDTWEYAVNLSMNYLEKVPKIIELGFTAFLSVILGKFKATYYPLEEYKSKQSLYLTFFTERHGYDKSELISTSMNPSYFMNKLYDNYRLKKNLDFCENDSFFKSHFAQTKYWMKKLDEKNSYCKNAASGGCLFFNKQIDDVHAYFTYMGQMAFFCRQEAEKLDESGMDLEIDFILQELSYVYSDFEQRMKTNLTEARNIFFWNANNIRILKDMNVPFSFGSGTIYSAVDVDMKDLTNDISKYEFNYLIIIFIIDGLFLLYIFYMITINEKDKNIIVYIAKILQKE